MIIEERTRRKLKKFSFHCSNCKKELVIIRKELIKSRKYVDICGHPIYYHKCPFCKLKTYFNETVFDSFQ